MSLYQLRKQLFIILDAYLKELSTYQYSESVINHISAYFYNISLTGTEYQQDIIDFLKHCPCKAAQQIFNRLSQIFDQNIGGLLE